jgi:hypothetical protein
MALITHRRCTIREKTSRVFIRVIAGRLLIQHWRNAGSTQKAGAGSQDFFQTDDLLHTNPLGCSWQRSDKLADLEETTTGCRWLLDRWEEYRNLLDRRLKWSEPVLVRFIRLQGKNMIESIFDPALNSIFLAWDALYPNYAAAEWESLRKERRINDPAYNHRLHWQEITRRPGDPAEAWGHLYGIVDHHVARLKELLIRRLRAARVVRCLPQLSPRGLSRGAEWATCSSRFEKLSRASSKKPITDLVLLVHS